MSDPTTRDELYDAAVHTLARLQKAKDAWERSGQSLETLRDLMIARDEHAAVMKELDRWDEARDVRAAYRYDKRGGRRGRWD
jgi:hypothetical protein